jgi:hypothetical protein
VRSHAVRVLTKTLSLPVRLPCILEAMTDVVEADRAAELFSRGFT